VADYRIEPDGTVVVFLSERATKRAFGPNPKTGSRLAFKTRSETAQFVRARETEASYLRERNFWPRRRDARSFVNGPNSRTAHQLDGAVPRGPTCSRNLWTTNVLYIPSALSLQYRSFSPKTRLVSRRRNSEPAVACSLGPWSPTRALRGEGCRIQNLLLWLA
jgi:hypothetical protein